MRTTHSTPQARLLAVAAAAILTVVLAACSEDDEPAATTRRAAPTTTESTTTTEAPADDGEKEPAGDGDQSDLDAWERTASPYRDQVGEEVDFECTPDGEAHSVWGTNEYTDDSSVCTAAVQMGIISLEDGGDVTILIGDGAEAFEGTVHNGIESLPYGPWDGSFTFPDAEDIEGALTIPWDRTASYYASQEGVITGTCPEAGVAGSIWGTDTYTSDSSICTAAVHAGLISLEDGGEVSFSLVEGLEEYEGSEANGITSQGYGAWDSAFTFAEA